MSQSESLGMRICRLRGDKRLSQGDLADLLGVSRQSVSKWETDSSVPDLDKLVRMAELFEVSLDELVLGREKEDSAPPAHPAPAAFPVRCAVGIALLCLAGLTVILCTVLGGLLEGLVLALPFLACGVICLAAKRHPGLWCAWAVYLLVGGYLSWATGTRWSAIVYTFRYLDLGSPVHVAMAWGMVLIAALLVFATARAFRGTRLSPSRRSVVLTAAGWVIWLLATVTPLGGYVVWPLYLLLDSSWVFQLWDLLRLAALTALVCVTAALRRGRGEKA